MESTLDQHVSRDIAFVFNNVANYQTLLEAFKPGVEVHVLDAQRDGLEQIAAILAGRSGIDGVHVIGHGAPGMLELGTLTLDSSNVGAYAAVLGRIGSSLAPGGDILLYGCDIAAGVAGAQFVGQIAQETGADVAASVDATGGQQLGGNWTLEYQQGDIGAHPEFDAAAVRSLDTLLTIPAAGLKDVTSSMDLTPGNFVTGFTLGSTVAVLPDTGTPPSTHDGIYFDSTADQTTATKDATFTITADNVNLGSFDLTALAFDKYGGAYPAAFLFTVTGYKPDGTVKATLTIQSSANATGYDAPPNFSAFTGIVKYTVEIASQTLINGGTAYPVSNWTFDSFTIANPHGPNVVTTFLGNSIVNVVQSTGANNVIPLLHVNDTDNYQTLTWTQLTAPTHGVLSITGGTAAGGTTDITPGGSITYTPNSAYVGTDTFTIKVYDGFQAVTKTVTVNVVPTAPSAPNLTAGTDSGTSTSDKITKLTVVGFSGTGAVGDSVSTVKVWVDKNNNGVYDSGTDPLATTPMSNGTWSVSSIDVSSLADGTYKVYAQSTGGGQFGALSAAGTFTVDRTKPTVTITSSSTSLTPADTATITFTFSEDPGTSFTWDGTSGDLTVSGGTVSALSGSGTVRTATFTPDGVSTTASVSVVASSYFDVAGNFGNGGSSPAINVIIDTTPPAAPTLLALQAASNTGVNPADNATKLSTPTVTGSAEAGSTVKLYEGATLLGSTTADGSGNWTITTSTLADGSHTLTATAKDAAGNVSTASSGFTIKVDTVAPTLSISNDASSTLKIGQTSTITFTFSEDPGSTFTSTDIAVSGGTLGVLSGSGNTRTAVFTPSNGINAGTAGVTVAGSSYTDAAGNAGTGTASTSFNYDTKAPTLTITSDATGPLKIGQTATVTFSFSEDPGGSFLSSDIAVIGGTLGSFAGIGATRTAVFTPTANTDNGSGMIAVGASTYNDAAGNTGAADSSLTISYDTKAPAAPSTPALAAGSDTGTSSTDNLTKLLTPSFTGTAEVGATVNLYDGATLIGSGTAGADTKWTIASTTNLSNGAHNITAVAEDAAHNLSTASGTLAISVDAAAPTLVISSDATSTLKTGETATLTFTFSEDPGSTFSWDGSSGSVVVSGGTLSAISGSGNTRTAIFTPAANTDGGSATISVAAAAYTDAAGNAGAAAASPTIGYDTKAPTVAITISNPAMAIGDTSNIVFTFSENPGASFDASDLVITGGTLGPLLGTGLVRSATFFPDANTNNGVASISVTAHSYSDAAGNTGSGAASPGMVFDTLAPTVSITSDKAALKAGETATITFTFSEDPGSSFTSGSVAVSGGTLGAISGTGTSRTAVFTPTAGTNLGTASITIAAGAYTDAARNDGLAGATPSISYDTLAPTLAITSDKAALKFGESATITFTFSEDPGSSFTSGAIAVTGGTLGAITGTGTVRTAVFTPAANTNGGTGSITVAHGAYTDAAGNDGGAGTTPSLSFDTLPPAAPSAPVLDTGSDTGTSHTDKLTYIGTPTLSGAAEAGATVKLYDGATMIGTGTADGAGNWSITTSYLADGTHSIAAVATDAAGNTGVASATADVTVDTIAPALVITSDTATLRAGQTATITFSFSEDPGSTFSSASVGVSGGTLGAISGSGNTRTAVFTPTADTNAGAASISVAHAAYTDAAGNDGGSATLPTIHYDTLAPTVTITSDKPLLKIGETATITFTFSEDPGTSFGWDGTIGTVSVSGGTLSATSGSGTTRTAVFTPTAGTNGGTASITVGEGVYLDAAGNPGHAGTTPGIVFDTLAPNGPSTPILDPASDSGFSSSDKLTKIASPTLTGTAEAGATVKLYDGATVVGTGTADGSGNWSIVANTLAEGSHSIIATATDAAGNTGTGSAALAVVVDTTAPTLAITSAKAALIAGETATITFTFSEDPGTTFTSGDIVVSGGTLSALSGSGAVRTAVFTPTTNTNSGTASITVAGGLYTDAAGNAGGAGTTPSIQFDTLVPTVAITSDKAALKIGETATITFTFSEDPGVSFTGADLTVSGGTLGAISGTGAVRTAVFTPTANTNGGTASITIGEGNYLDAAGNAGHAGSTPSLVFDTLAPNAPSAPVLATASDSGTSSNDNLTKVTTPTLTGSAEAGATVKLYDGATMVGTGTADGAGNWSIVTSTLAEGSHSIVAKATDAAGNTGAGSAALAIVVDTTGPALAITSDKAALIAGQTAAITFTFSEDPGSTFTSGDIVVAGGTLSALSGSGNVRTAVFTPTADTNAGAASITVAGASYTDAAGNAGGAGATPSLHFDTLAPTVAISSDKAALKGGETATITFTFSEDPGSSFTSGSVAVSGGTLGAIAGTGTTRTAVFTPTANTNGGSASISIADGAYGDAAGNAGHAGSAPSLVFDTKAPTLAISSDKAALIAGQAATVTFTFSEDPGSSFTSGDIVVSGGTLSALSGSGAVRTAMFTPTADTNAGTASITVAGGLYTDAAGNAGGAGTTPSIQFDTLVPTVAITSDKSALKIGETATITFTFSEDPGASFTSADLTISGGTLGAISGTGTTRTAVFTPTANTNGGTASITIGEGSYLDAAGNAGHAGSTPSVVFDTLAPNAPSAPVLATASDSGTSTSDNLTKVTTPTLTGSAEAGATVKLYDGATVVGTGTADGSGNWSIVTSTLAEGSHSIVAKATDAAGNTGAGSAALGVLVDTTGPALAITSDKAALIAGQTAAITFTFSEDPGSTFTSGDIVVSGGTLSALSGSGNVRTAVFTPTANTNTGTASITVAGGAYTDAAGNAGGAGATPSVHFDTLVPTVAISSDKAALKIGETAAITFTFSEDPGASFTSADLAISGGTLGPISGTGTVRTAVFTPTANTNGGTAGITIGEGSYLDAAGNAGHAGSAPSVVFDTLAPNAPSAPSLATASDSGTSSSDQLTNIATPTLTGSAEAGATIKLYDGAALVGTGTADGAGNWSIVTNTLAQGSHAIAATATDAAGNTGAASAALAISIDQTAPTLVISSDKAALIAGQTATVTFTFSEDPGSTFTSGDIVVSGGTLSALSGTGAVRTAVFTPTADMNAGTASITVASSVYTDAAGNAGGAGTTPSIHFDTLVPTVSISSDKAALKIGETATITFSFSEDPGASFTSGDLTVSGGALGAITGTGATRTAVFTPDANTNGGTASITIGEGSYLDAAGNAGHAGATPALVFDTKAPTLAITSDKAALIAGQTATVSFTFSEDPGSSFTSDDIVVSGGTLSALSGTGTVRTAVFTPTADTNAGTASITVASGVYSDAAGNAGGAGTTPAIQFDTLVPTVAITSDKSALKIGEAATITFTFSEDPGASFTSGDLAISGGTLGAISGTGATRTAVFTPTAGTNGGTASITIDAGKYTDAAGNPGQAGATPVVVFDTLAPAAPSAPVLAAASDNGASSSDNITNAQTLKFTGTAEDGATVTLIDNTSKAVLATGTATGGAWSIDVNGLPEGVTSVAAFATDAAGNTGATSAALAVTIDRTAPGAPSLALASGAASGSTVNDGTVKVLNLAPGASWQYSLDAGAHWSAGTGDNFKLTADNSYTAIVRQLDIAGNISTSSAQLKFNLDTTGPTSTVTISDNALVSGETATVTIRFSEPVAGFGLDDVSASSGTLSNLVSRDGGLTWTATLTPAGGTVASTNVVTVNNAGVTDGAGNAGVGTNSSPNYSVQTSAIGASIVLSDSSLAAGETAVVTISFTEAVPGLRLSNLGVANGVLSGLSSADGGLTWTATLTPAANTRDATNVITLDNASLTGISGQHGQGTSTSANYGVFTVRPSATVSLADHVLAPGGSTAVTIKFSTAVSDFDGADISVTHATLSSLRSADGGVTWTGTLTAAAAAAAAQPGSIEIDLRGVHDAAGNTGLGLTSAAFVLASANAKSSSVDGVTILTDTFKDPHTGLPQQVVAIPDVQPGRVDDSSTSHPGLADIPLASAPGSSTPTLTASLPTGAGMLELGSAAPLSANDAATDLVRRITDNTASGSSTQADMAAHAQDFLASLAAGTVVQTSTIVPTVARGATLDQPIVISGATPPQGATNAPVVGLVIDGTGLPAGTTLQLDNVNFAAVTGDVRLFGGLGQNYVVGDAGSQTIYLGPDDDVLFGGGGDDFIGSAGGNDILHGGDGNDLVAGGIGNDTLFGDAGNDTVNGGRSTTGNWSFHISASGAISAVHSGAVFTLNGSETVQSSELDATVPELRFLKADQQKVAGIALLYAALDRVPDLAGLSFWATSGASLQDVAKGVLASAEFGATPLGQAGNVAFITGMYQHVLGRAPEQAALDYWNGRLTAGASRADVLTAVALSDEHKAGATKVDGITIGQGSVRHEAGWFAGSGDDILDGGAGSDWLVGGDGFDTVVYSGNRAQYHFTIGADNQIHVLDTANGDLDTLLGIESARFKDGTIDITVLERDPAQLARVGLMYEAVLHRPADLASLASWTAQNMSATQLAQAFTASADYQSKFAGMSDAAFVQALYANSGLAASAAGGMQSWQDYLGHHSRAELIATWIGQDAVVQAQFGANGLWLA
ncbi:hypothetical protein GCM10027321_40080 [Massilia terrae]|uniref:Ig-like domain-containing protein n=1 Tax=Massilia terrae TaxID=1811224 RepID=A0ABT2D4I3_9BURK|nr:Ig-like domain-containing protein [Massilia terrae]MCS0661151.1 Ig-like domain-containing protein [Massilia terrae]